MFIIVILLIFPIILLSEIIKQNEKSHREENINVRYRKEKSLNDNAFFI